MGSGFKGVGPLIVSPLATALESEHLDKDERRYKEDPAEFLGPCEGQSLHPKCHGRLS